VHGLPALGHLAVGHRADVGRAVEHVDAVAVGTPGNIDRDSFNGTAADMDAWLKTYTNPPEVSLTATVPVLQAGHADSAGASFSVHRLQALIAVIGKINNLAAASAVSADGVFGPETTVGLKAVQQYYKIAASGLADKDTWDILVAGTP